VTTVTFEWTIEHLETINDKGQKMSKVIESYGGLDYDPRTFYIPSTMAEAFVRARREFTQRLMWSNGGVKLLLN
jgi:hypothetical protein